MNERKPNRMIPLCILIAILIISTLVVYLSMSEQRKKNFFNAFADPFSLDTSNTNLDEEPEPAITLSVEEAIPNANNFIKNSESIYIKTYKDSIYFRNLIKAWGYNEKEKVYMEEDKFYIDLKENTYYYIEDEKWKKKENELDINIKISDYCIPSNAKQLEDERIDGALCYVFEYENKTYYIKHTTAQLSCIKEVIDEITYYHQISYKEILIRDEIKETAIN